MTCIDDWAYIAYLNNKACSYLTISIATACLRSSRCWLIAPSCAFSQLASKCCQHKWNVTFHQKVSCAVQVSLMSTVELLSRLLQDLSTATASAGSDPYVMADGSASTISPVIPASARSASASDNAGYIAGVAIAVALALAVLVALLIFICHKRNASRSEHPPENIIVRFVSD
jgi:hypothetical protein